MVYSVKRQFTEKSCVKHAVRLLIAVFIFTMFSGFSTVKAAGSSAYFNGQYVKVGLESMMNNSITVTLNGDYYINNVFYRSGTSLKITNSNGKVALNGAEADSLNFEHNGLANTLTIVSGSSSHKYLGNMLFQVKTVRGNTAVLPINTVYIENYLRGVLPYEMSNSFQVEALKAQAVAARNYVLRNLGKYSSNGYDVSDNTYDQVYKGYSGTQANIDAAVDGTKAMILLYGTSLVDTYYSANNGGYTEDSGNVWTTSLPYYVEKPDMYNPEYNWTETYTIDQIDAQLKSRGIITAGDKFTKINTSTIKYYTSGRVSSIDLVYTDSTGTEKTITRTKDGTRSYLPLQSTMYTVLYNEAAGSYTFTGKGNGHGIGMSQDGAQQAALQGLKYDAILGFYYTGTQIQKATSTLSSVTLSKTSVQAGESLTITANAAGGSGSGYFYLYEISKNGVQVYSSNPVSNSSIQYTPAEAGDYAVKVSVMDKLTNAEAGYDDTKTVSFTAAAAAGQTTLNGWVLKNSSWYLYENNNYLTGWQQVNNKWYYLDNTGIMKIGWHLDGTTWYFLDNSGAMATGWIQLGGKWYFLRSSGAMATGWIQSGSKWYYLYSSGAMAYSTYIGTYKLDASGAWIK